MKNIKYLIPVLLVMLNFSCGSVKEKNTKNEATMTQNDINKMPASEKAPKIKFKKPQVFKMSNGLTIIVVENHKLPRVNTSLRIDNPPVKLRDKKGADELLSALLGSGSQSTSKDEFNKKIDFYGAYVYLYDGGFSINSLSKYFPEILKLTADQAIHPKFSKEEFAKEKEKLVESLKSAEKSTPAAAQRVMQKLAYGQHPYGEVTEINTVKNVKLSDVNNYYKKSFTPNHAYLIVVGDVNPADIEKMAHQNFSDWQKAPQVRGVALPAITDAPATEVDFVHMPNAEQTEIKVVHRSDIRKNNPDYQKVLLMNSILGGDFNSYLNMTLREKHGWTYGARSGFGTDKYGDLFRATTSVRNAVADSAVVVTMEQINKIRNEKVDTKLLYNNKQKYLGNFVLKMEKPATIANQAYDIYVNHLPEDYYETFLQKIEAVTVDDIQQVAQKYLHPDKARIIVAGNAETTVPKLRKAGYRIKFYDKYGNSTKAPKTDMKIPAGVTVKTVIDKYIKALGGQDKINKTNSLMTVYEGKVQNMTLKITDYAMKPNKSLKTTEAMGMVFSKEVFDGQNGKRMVRGMNQPFPPEKLEEMKNTSQPFSELDLLKKGKLTKMGSFDGNDYYIITDDKKNTYYFNVKTGLIDKEIKHEKVQGRDMATVIYLKDYKDVDGVKIPSKITISSGVQDMNFKLIDAKVNSLKAEDFK